MANPGGFNPGAGEDWIGRKFAALEQEIRELRAANVFGLTGITPKDGGTDFDGYANFNGNMSITGTLNLPAGIIGNEALANPIDATSIHVDAENFALSTGASVEKVRATFTVPEGFTRALVFATATMGANNTSASTDNMYLACVVNGSSPGWQSKTAVVNGVSGNVANSATKLLTGLGPTFYVSAVASSGINEWPAPGPGNGTHINLDVFAIYLR